MNKRGRPRKDEQNTRKKEQPIPRRTEHQMSTRQTVQQQKIITDAIPKRRGRPPKHKTKIIANAAEKSSENKVPDKTKMKTKSSLSCNTRAPDENETKAETDIEDKYSGDEILDKTKIKTSTAEKLSEDKVTDDEMEIETNTAENPSENEILDKAKITTNTAEKLSENEIPEKTKITTSTAENLSENEIPDNTKITADTAEQLSEDEINEKTKITTSTAEKLSENEIPDKTKITTNTAEKFGENEIPDKTKIETNTAEEPLENYLPNKTEIKTSIVDNLSENKVPENMMITNTAEKVLENEVPDKNEIKTSTAEKLSENEVPDKTEIKTSTIDKVSENEVPDETEIKTSTIDKVSENEVPDKTEIKTSPADKLSENEIVPDKTEIKTSTIDKLSENEVPDKTEITTSTTDKLSENEVPDEMQTKTDSAEKLSDNEVPDISGESNVKANADAEELAEMKMLPDDIMTGTGIAENPVEDKVLDNIDTVTSCAENLTEDKILDGITTETNTAENSVGDEDEVLDSDEMEVDCVENLAEDDTILDDVEAKTNTAEKPTEIKMPGEVEIKTKSVEKAEGSKNVEAALADLESLAALSSLLLNLKDSWCGRKDDTEQISVGDCSMNDEDTVEMNELKALENDTHESSLINNMEFLKFDFEPTQVEKATSFVPTVKDNSSEMSTRMKMILKECSVILHPLTEEDIYKSYPDTNNGISNDVLCKTNEMLDAVHASEGDGMQVTFRRDGSRRRMRDSKNNYNAFEQYRLHRKGFLKRRNNKASLSENSMSQDESRSVSDGLKGKKKGKKVRKYERDFEWSPFSTKTTFQNNRKLRNQNTRALESESESSSTDEQDFLLSCYLNDDSNYIPSEFASQNVVPSEFNHGITSSEKCGSSNENRLSSVNSASTSQKFDSGDIDSNTTGDMYQVQRNQLESFPKNMLHTQNTPNNFKKTKKKGRKRLKLLPTETKSEDVDKEVRVLLKYMIDKISPRKNHLARKKTVFKICKWCDAEFSTNKNSEVLCATCRDLKIGQKLKSVFTDRKPLIPRKRKSLKENKGKKVSKTMSKVFKKFSKNEMQRLMYAEKSDRSADKGYNHCKSFVTPKECDKDLDECCIVDSNKTSVKVSNAKQKKQLKRKSDNHDDINRDESSLISTQMKSNKHMKLVATDEKDSKKKCVSLKKFNEGLFLMTFPDDISHEDLNNLDEKEQNRQTKVSASNSLRNIVDLASKNSSNEKQVHPVNNKQHDTYLFPPIPTVIVSNYSSDTNSLNLSHTYYQNEITHQHANKSLNTPSRSPLIEKSDISNKISATKKVSILKNTSCQNPPFSTSSLLPNATTFTITTIPINEHLKQLPSIAINPVVLNQKTSVPANMTLMPVISSVMSVASRNTIQTNAVKENVPSNVNLFPSNNFNNLQITLSQAASQNTDSFTLNSDVLSMPRINNENNIANKQINIVKCTEMSMQEKSSNRNPLQCFNTSVQEDTSAYIDGIETNKEMSNRTENSNNSLTANSNSGEGQSLYTHSSSNKPVGINENVGLQNTFPSVVDVLEAVSILAIIDLERNPLNSLNNRIQLAKGTLAKLTNEKSDAPEYNKKVSDSQYHVQLLNIAKHYLSLYGSFIKVSDHLLRKARIIQIKKELFEETNQTSCMFSQSSELHNSLSNSVPDLTRSTEVTNVTTNVNNSNSGKSTNQAAINHIEKIQSQIAAMNNAQLSHFGLLPNNGIVHQYPAVQITALSPAVVAPTPVTPRNDCFLGDSRETPSRGSGPRTPARPESAASLSEEQSSVVQIKKEQFEGASSPASQCSFSQNTTLTQISNQLPVLQEMSSLNTPQYSVSNTTINVPVTNTNQANLHLQSRELAPNRTVTYNNNNNQNYSDVLLNIATKHSVSVTPVASNSQISQNRQVLLGQQMFIQNGSGLSTKQAVPSINANQYILRQPLFTSTNTGRTVIVNNPQVAQNALLTNVSNQQFYTSNPVSQIYYPPSSQITCMPNSNISTISSPDLTAAQIQQSHLDPDNMICAVCKSPATLRCKQCARVAYCNTTCAKTYWHQKHKMECKPLGS